MKVKQLISAATGAAQSQVIEVSAPGSTVTIAIDSANGLIAGVETAVIEYTSDGFNFDTLYRNGAIQQLSTSDTAITVTGPLAFRVNKGVTSNSVGVVAFLSN